MIVGVGNDVQDALVRQTIGIGPYLSFPRVNDVPMQWVQLLNGFDQQELYGWPMLTPLKIQMQKCDKCSLEFCSTVNYRRHIRVHRRLKVDKDSYKSRDSLGAFWDKVSLDEAKNILSFKDVTLEGLPGSSIIKALASFIRAPGFCTLPQVYVKAGLVLLDAIEATPSRLPISSQELFTVLDDASERTFLSGSTEGSVQKFIFDGEARKVGLEIKNLVACTSFLIEQSLVKAWIADKDAEALRCQKLLVEEEEAAQRRQAELLERKRLRKLRQKEQKTKGRSCKETTVLTSAADILETVPSAESSTPPQSEADLHAVSSPPQSEVDLHSSSSPPQSEGDLHTSSSLPHSEGDLHELEDHSSVIEPVHIFNNEVNGHINIEGGYNSELVDIGRAKNVELPESQDSNNQQIVDSKLQVLESKSEQNACHPSHSLDVVKPDPIQAQAPPNDLMVAPVNGSDISTGKGTVENGRECVSALLHEREISQTDHTSCEVMIGSITVTLRNCTTQKQHDDSQSESLHENCSIDHVTCENVGAHYKQIKPESTMNNTLISNDRHEVESEFVVQTGVTGVGTMPDKCSHASSEVDSDSKQNDFIQPAKVALSSHSARAFLAHRWKEAISEDHETLVLSQEAESQGHCDAINECSEAVSTVKAIDSEELSVLGRAKNFLDIVGAPEYPTSRPVDSKRTSKPRKGYQMKVQR
ncbi:uncharacterized protein LOC108200310 [Daucus carota subsp. sativus]|nr:PREDICTED: uncharacterized protein LOC108200310 [Daucus carota subsp. sativus]